MSRRCILLATPSKARGNRWAAGLREQGYAVHVTASAAAARELLTTRAVDLLWIEDSLLPLPSEAYSPTPVESDLWRSVGLGLGLFVLGAQATGAQAQEYLAAGATDFLPVHAKPADLLLTLYKAAGRAERQQDPAAARFLPDPAGMAPAPHGDDGRDNPAPDSHGDNLAAPAIVALSMPMREVLDRVEKVAPFSTTVLITGETGVGKELVARALHAASPRRDQAFLAVNCGAIPEALLESTLFGHKKGAFTGAHQDHPGLFRQAHRGTLFLDEIGELPTRLQVKLLRVLQDRQVQPIGSDETFLADVRVIAATLRDLAVEVSQGRFRQDLYYRLNVVHLHIPPLRQRPADILPLARLFLHKLAQRAHRPLAGCTRAAEALLMSHRWPGNVRELENVIERAFVLSEGTLLDAADLPLLPPSAVQLRGQTTEAAASQDLPLDTGTDHPFPDVLSIKHHTKELEARLIRAALQKSRGNRTQAARLLDLSHRALLYKLKALGLDGSD